MRVRSVEQEKEEKKISKIDRFDERSISPAVLENIKEQLVSSHAELIVRGLLDNSARIELKHKVLKEHGHVVKSNEQLAEKIVSETVGTGVIEEIVKDETITDIGYNGTDLIIESNDIKKKYNGSTQITEEYIVRIIQKFANAVGKDFTPKEPNLSAVFGNIRLDATHSSRSSIGKTTMSLRIVRPKLVLNESNFEEFAPKFMYDFFKKCVVLRTNIAISGETGTGKTELQKLMMSFITFDDKTIVIEDVPESHVKELFPDKDIISWLAGEGWPISKAIKAALRNNPRWIMVTETRGEEAYELIQAVLSGHHIITSLHAVNAGATPKRFVNMAKMGYNISEDTLEEDIRRYFDFGFHIKRVKYQGKTIRYLSEIVAYDLAGDKTVFEQKFKAGKLVYKTFELLDEIKERFEDAGLEVDFPENKEGSKILNFQ